MSDIQINRFIASYPKETLWLGVLFIGFTWQFLGTILGIVLYYLFKKFSKYQWWVLLIPGMIIILLAINLNFQVYVKDGFRVNFFFFRKLFAGDFGSAFLFIVDNGINYILSFPLFFAGIMSVIEKIPDNPHKKIMGKLYAGKIVKAKELDYKQLRKKIININEDDYDETVLGVSKFTGLPVILPDKFLNQIVLVLGTTGGGKTITLRRIYGRAIKKGYPLIIIDGKPDQENIDWIISLAKEHNRKFFGFNCGEYSSYNPLAHGSYTELKDKIISLKDEWSSDHYRSIAEDYLQTTFYVLLNLKKSLDLKLIAWCLDYTNLATLARESNDQLIKERVSNLANYDKRDITGLHAHLNILVNSELGSFFCKDSNPFNLFDEIKNKSIIFFALPVLRYPSFSKVLGKLVVNDMKTIVDRNGANNPIFIIMDEFSVFASDQALNLINMGRGKGVHAVFGTQGLADLEKVDNTFKGQFLNCVNTLISHRLNDQESAETVSNWVGTKPTFTITAQMSINDSSADLGTLKYNKEFIIHPDSIKQDLEVGEAFYITKVNKFKVDKVLIKFIEASNG